MSNRNQNQAKALPLGLALLAVLISALCLVPTALAGTAHEYKASFGPDGSEASKFKTVGPLAVDQGLHVLYVSDLEAETIYKFSEATHLPANFSALASSALTGVDFRNNGTSDRNRNQVAVDPVSHRIYVTTKANTIAAYEPSGEAAKFSGIAGEPSAISGSVAGGPFVQPCGMAVDANGAIYVGDVLGNKVRIFAPSGLEITSFVFTNPCHLAVDSQGVLYVNTYAGSVSKYIPSSFPVTPLTTYSNQGQIDPGPGFAVEVDRGSGDLYVDRRLPVPQFDKSKIVQHHEVEVIEFAGPGEPGELQLPGAIVEPASLGVAYAEATGAAFVSHAGKQQVELFAAPPRTPPSVGATSATSVTSSSAELEAQVNANLSPTSYHFEYLSEAEYQANGESFAGAQSTPEVFLGSSGEPQPAHGHAGGLAPDTTYRFRAVATSHCNAADPGEVCTVASEPPPSLHTFPATAPGLPDGRAYEMVSPPVKAGEVFPPEPGGTLGGSCDDCLPGATYIMMPMQAAPDGGSVLYAGQPLFAGIAAQKNEYLARRTAGGWGTESLSSPLFQGPQRGYRAFAADLSRGVISQVGPPLSSAAPTREGEAFANLYLWEAGNPTLLPLITAEPPHRTPGDDPAVSFNAIYAGANAGAPGVAAFSHLAFEANDALTAAVPTVAPEAPEVSVTENNLFEWVGGQLRLVNVLPGNAAAAPGAVIGSGRLLDDDGGINVGPDVEHAVSNDGRRIFWSDAAGQAYVRIDGKETKEVQDSGKFLTATPEGAKMLLSDGCLYDVEAEGCEADLSQGGGEEKFEGILGAADDLSRVYFVDTEALTGSEENANEEVAAAGKPNLYAWHEGATSFIGTLDASDAQLGSSYGDWKAARQNRTAQVSPDGRYLAFMSRAALTGYQNEVSAGGHCKGKGGVTVCSEVFAYDALAGTLTCASCNPSEQRPIGQASLSVIRGFPVYPPFPQPENLPAQGHGRLFFESQDVLSPYDTNGQVQDVYQWEPSGVGGCKRAGGCISLISSGHSANDSMFLNSTPSGNDAFFVTREQLLVQDKDDLLDLYDARVGGGIPAEAETLRPECQGEACQPAAIVPSDPTPASSSFSGAGNLNEKPSSSRCPKSKARRKGRCVAKKHRKRAKRSNHRANADRRAAR